MMRFPAAFLLITLIGSFPTYGQTINISVTDFTMLRNELLTSRQLLTDSVQETESLRMNLNEARRLYEASELTIVELETSLDFSEERLNEAEKQLDNSETKINDLETRLEEALNQQSLLQDRIDYLETLLTELYTSLINTEIVLDGSEERIINDIESLVTGYERRLKVYRILLLITGSVALGAGTYALIGTLQR